MDETQTARRMLLVVVASGVFLALVVEILVAADVVAKVLSSAESLIGPMFLGALFFVLLAWVGRLAIAGRLSQVDWRVLIPRPALIVWGGFRISMLIAVFSALSAWLVALLLDFPNEPNFLHALVLLVLISGITFMLGNGVFNMLLILRRPSA